MQRERLASVASWISRFPDRIARPIACSFSVGTIKRLHHVLSATFVCVALICGEYQVADRPQWPAISSAKASYKRRKVHAAITAIGGAKKSKEGSKEGSKGRQRGRCIECSTKVSVLHLEMLPTGHAVVVPSRNRSPPGR